jgi:hypothetical protein
MYFLARGIEKHIKRFYTSNAFWGLLHALDDVLCHWSRPQKAIDKFLNNTRKYVLAKFCDLFIKPIYLKIGQHYL